MSVNIKQCRKCKRLFQTYGSNICPDCIDQMDKEYLLVKEYIYSNPDADVVEVSEYTGVGKKTILEFLREGRLTIANNDGLLTCIECSKPISVGRYCDDCRSKLEKALNSSVRMEGNRGNSGYGRMHADFMDEDDFRGELKMRINSIPPKEIYNRYIHVHKKQEADKPDQGADKTELTSEAKTFSATFNAVKEAMEVRTPEETKRINEVAQQIKDNTYSVPGRAVARKILGK